MGTTLYRRFALPALKRLDAEAVHHHTLALLRAVQAQPLLLALLRRHYQVDDPRLRVTCFGREFANPLGLAAGFDKNGTAPTALAALGFGHIEVGTATPRPQPGRPRPRIFRLPEDAALINRLGFPSEGMTDVATRLRAYANRRYVLGVNVGPNVASVEAGAATADYLAALAHLSATRRLPDHQRLLAQHPGPARLASRSGAGRAAASRFCNASAHAAGNAGTTQDCPGPQR